jgi:hypothetical protein
MKDLIHPKKKEVYIVQVDVRLVIFLFADGKFLIRFYLF